MKCRYCGTQLEPDALYCPRCNREVRYVPDYNPLEDVLAAQVRDSWSQSATIPPDKNPEQPYVSRNYSGNYTGYYSQNQTANRSRNTERTSVPQRTGRTSGRTSDEERQYRKRQAARKQERLRQKKKKRRVLIISILVILACIMGGVFLLYQNSYSGLVKSGNTAVQKEQYNKAIKKFEKAVSKNGTKADAYVGLSNAYIAQKDTGAAESVFIKAVEKHPSTAALYKAACKFYVDTDQLEKISPFIDECSDNSVLKELSTYTVKQPSFSLDQSTYDDVQELKLTSKGNDIYYTIDGSEPTSSSTKYSEPIQIKEGDNTVKAIAYNGKDIPSLTSDKTFTVTFPTAKAPSVTPSTGRYDQEMKITITVPEGYTAYYTLDGSTPTSSSEKYEEPIDMPEGTNTIFSAILIDKNGRVSEIAKRNYDLDLE